MKEILPRVKQMEMEKIFWEDENNLLSIKFRGS